MSKSKSKQKLDILDKVESMPTTKKVIDLSKVNIADIKLPPGRPVDPNSPRQQRLAEMETKRAAGELKRGRPADPNSPNYQKRVEAEARKAQPGYIAKRGRPTDPDSPRQQKLATQMQHKEERIKQMVAAGKIMLVEDGDDIIAVPVEHDVETITSETTTEE